MQKLRTISVLCVVKGRNAADGLKMLLNRGGMNQVFATDDAENVFDIVSGASIDIVLIQDNPPEIDGVELCKTVRTSPKSPNIKLPLVVLFPRSNMTRTVDAIAAGANEMLLYPVDPGKLLHRMTAAMNCDRKFIQEESYVGPDRRLVRKWDYKGPFRRQDDEPDAQEENEAWCSDEMKKYTL